jgi:transcriptional regulator with XRE-family HTH domain
VKIRECRDRGLTKEATARRLGLDRKTIAKSWEGPADDLEKPGYQRRPRLTDPYEEYVTDRLDEWPELTAEASIGKSRRKGIQVTKGQYAAM